MPWFNAVRVEDLVANGGMIGCTVAGVPIALYAVAGAYYATSDICTHGQARLSDGWLEGHVIECPIHQGLFDIRTGEVKGPPCTKPVRVFEVKVQDGALMVRIEADAPADAESAQGDAPA